MQELSQTSTQIAGRSRTVQQTSSEVLRSALEVAATTAQVSDFSTRGQKSVSETAISNQIMRSAYQSLNKRLQELSQYSARIQEMLDLIETISDETHLISLNAAIEAAGAGEHGERFGVVAQEVKHLADRARGASAEVRKVVTEVVAALDAAREESASGDKMAEKAAQSAQQSAQVITEYEVMVKQAATKASEIAHKATKMEEIARQIGLAIGLQQNASEQVLAALLTVQNSAQTNAVSSGQVASSTSRLQTMASNFK